MIEKYEHIFWDWNGTLFNDIDLCIDIMNSLLQKNKMELLSIERYKDIFTIPVSNYYKTLGFDITNGTFEIVGREFMDIYELRKCECSLFPEVNSVLNQIKKSGIKQSVLSAYPHDVLLEILQTYNINKYFLYVMGASDIYAKGKIEQGKELIKLVDSNPDKIVMIGDSVHDFDVANALGIECILIANGHQSRNVLEKSGAKVVNTLNELFT